MTVATREKCPCCDFDSDGFGKNIIGKGYGSCEIRLYRANKYDFYIYSYSSDISKKNGPRDFRSRRIMPDWIYAALFLAILALGILLVGEL